MSTVPKPTPKYVQIADYFRGEIEAGRLRPGDQLGALQELALRFGCASETVRGAMEKLRIEGLVDIKRGLGVFVTEPADPEVTMDNLSDSLSEPVMMLIMGLAEERDAQTAVILARLDDLATAVASVLDKIDQKLAARPSA